MLNSYLQQAESTDTNRSTMSSSQALSSSHKDMTQVGSLSGQENNNGATPPSSKLNPLLYNRASLEQSLNDAKHRVAQLKRELDANYNLLTIIDKYYKKKDSMGVEVWIRTVQNC